MSEIDKYLSELRGKVDEIKEIEELRKEFPDLDVTCDRWKKQYYVSKKVYEIADEVMMRHSCGCCHDSPLYATPYVVRGKNKVFVDNIHICVGEKSYYGGDEKSKDLDEILEKYKFWFRNRLAYDLY